MSKRKLKINDAVKFGFAGCTESGTIIEFYSNEKSQEMAIVDDGKYKYPVPVINLIKI